MQLHVKPNPTVSMHVADRSPLHVALSLSQALPNSTRPIYSCTMEGLVVCFTGFKNKSEASSLCSRAHFMGATVRGDINPTVTHIVAHSVCGSKYKVRY